jgi:hypothetical protein
MVIHPAIEVDGAEDAEAIRNLITRARDTIGSALPADLR